ncbi:MAG TPA: GNAT family N-acetyltransferase [Longimicrobiaceae bacterium]|nr:GNAT family N-acetyltransferase [Longimicrobiaceae bacterium]
MPADGSTDDLFATPRLRARLLTMGDEDALQEVFQAGGDYFLEVTGRPEPDEDAAVREIASTINVPGRRVALVSLAESGEDVGALGWWGHHPEPDIALLGMLLVVPERRGAGVGREALGALEGVLAADGIRRLRTGVGAGDTAKHALLRALGFHPLDERTHVTLDRGRLMIALFEKEL